jgi:hypothetical protein
MSLVVVTGSVTLVGFAQRAGASLMLAAPLVLLGLVAVPATGQELGAARRDEIAVARLRGLHGSALLRMLAVEPGIAVGAGALLGYLLGTLGVWVTSRRWLDVPARWAGWPATIVAVGLVVATLVAVLLGMRRAVREPLADQVALASRPKPMSTLGIFAALVVVMAAAVATYRAQNGSNDPDWVVLVGPALVALASGQVAVALLGLLTRWAVARSAESDVPFYLAVRRLRGTAGIGGPVRMLVAATVLGTLALAGAGRVGAWTEQMARLEAGAAVQIPFDGGALQALQLTRTLDPEGRWLMAAVSVPGTSGGSDRRTFLDTERYDAVVGDLLDGVAGTSLEDAFAELRRDGVTAAVGAGDRWTVGVAVAQESGFPEGLHARVTLSYVTDEGVAAQRATSVPMPAAGAATQRTVALAGCAAGCVPTGLTVTEGVDGRPGGGSPRVPLLLTLVAVGDTDLLTRPWAPVDPNQVVSQAPAGITVRFGVRDPLVRLAPAPGALPVLATRGLTWVAGSRTVNSPGGVARDVDVLGHVDSGPFVQAEGVVADLGQALAADAPTVPVADVFVLANADTPADLLDAVAAAGGGEPRSLADVRQDLVDRTGAGQARAFALMALFCMTVALLTLVASAARLRDSYRREVAALRLLGIPADQIRRAGRAEVALLAVSSVGVGVVGGVLAVRLLLGSLPVVRLPAHAVALGSATPWWAILVAGGLAAVSLAAVQIGARRVGDLGTRPAILREGVTE